MTDKAAEAHRPWWTAAQLRAAIDRCEAEIETMIANHATPAAIEGRRRGVTRLHSLLRNAECQEMIDKYAADLAARRAREAAANGGGQQTGV